MKILFLIDGVLKPGHRWLWKYLPSNEDELDFLVTAGPADRFQKWGKLLSYYPTFWRTGLRALLMTRKAHYDLVIAWEGKNGFPYAFLRSLLGQKFPPLIIVAFNIRGVISHFLGVARFGLRSAARLVVLTPGEVERYQRLLSIPPETICYIPHSWYDDMESGALAPNMVSRRAACGRRAGGWGDAAAARGRKGALFFLYPRSTHSVFGASKVAADVMVQEYGRYFGIRTGTFRGGCLTGSHHSGVELHGFLSYLVHVAVTGKKYTVFGYKGKQVRDNIHSYDVIQAFEAFRERGLPGEVYNLGGGRENSISVLEAITRIEQIAGRKLNWVYDDTHRVGDHICYISDLRKMKSDFPSWTVTRSLDQILEEMVSAGIQKEQKGWTRALPVA